MLREKARAEINIREKNGDHEIAREINNVQKPHTMDGL